MKLNTDANTDKQTIPLDKRLVLEFSGLLTALQRAMDEDDEKKIVLILGGLATLWVIITKHKIEFPEKEKIVAILKLSAMSAGLSHEIFKVEYK